MTRTVPVRLDHGVLETLDLLVSLGVYKNRSEAIRELMKEGLEARRELKELSRAVKTIEALDRAGKIDLSGLQLERERF